MSDIFGEGYGSKHTWKRISTAQVGSAPNNQRFTSYKCKVCSQTFKHYYNLIPDIFEAMELEAVTDSCG